MDAQNTKFDLTNARLAQGDCCCFQCRMQSRQQEWQWQQHSQKQQEELAIEAEAQRSMNKKDEEALRARLVALTAK